MKYLTVISRHKIFLIVVMSLIINFVSELPSANSNEILEVVGPLCDLETKTCTSDDNDLQPIKPILISEVQAQVTATANQNRAIEVFPIPILTKGPKRAPITIIEFSDFQCPFCARVSPVLHELLEHYPDEIRLIFKHFPLPIHPDAPLAHSASMAAGEQGKFWEMHDLLFANQKKSKRDDLLGYAKQIGLDMEQFVSAIDSNKYRASIEQDVSEARAFGVNATPTFFLNGRKVAGARSLSEFQTIIDELLGRRKSAASEKPVTVDLEGAAVRGPQEALITIVEFSDFQCPFCGRVSPTLKQLLNQYPDQVNWVFKHFPLPFHSDAPLAHQATIAAGEQGEFWEMHDLIFASQHTMKRENLIQYATQLNLDVDRFQLALESEEIKAIIEKDVSEGRRLGVRGTPHFFINGRKLSGARSLSTFKNLIDEELRRLQVQSKPPVTDRSGGVSVSGPRNAPVTLALFSDFQSPMSAELSIFIKKILADHPEDVRLIFKHFPLRFHPEAKLAHEAALAAGKEGKFWEMHDLLFQDQEGFKLEQLIAHAESLGLDMPVFKKALEEHKYNGLVQRDILDGMNHDVRGVPTLFVNNTRVDGVQPVQIQKLIESALSTVPSPSGEVH